MIPNNNVLILYASYGDGHIQVSRVLNRKLSEQGMNVTMIDLFAESHPYINQLVRYMYLKSYSFAPSLYGLSYYLTQDMNHQRYTSRWFNAFGMRRLQELIEKEKPVCVINTFPMLVMPEYKRRMNRSIPIFTVMTDFVLHNRWIHNEINKYYVATHDLKNALVNAGVSSDKILDSGIPLREGFNVNHSPQDGSPSTKAKTVLIMAGAYGVLSHLKELCLFFIDTSYHLMVVCGKNKNLEMGLKTDFAEYGNIHVMGFIENIHELMALSSCIITKPGGITLSEALSAQKPIFLYKPSPGQEKENALYLEEKGVAVTTNSIENLVSQLFHMLENDSSYSSTLKNIQALQKPNATDVVVQDMLRELDRYYKFNKMRVNKEASRS